MVGYVKGYFWSESYANLESYFYKIIKINFLEVFGQKGDFFSKFDENPSHVSLTCLGWHGGNTDQADFARILMVYRPHCIAAVLILECLQHWQETVIFSLSTAQQVSETVWHGLGFCIVLLFLEYFIVCLLIY